MKAARLEWRNGFSVGIPVIDDQHRGMIDVLNDVGEAMARNDHAGCDRLFSRFLELSKAHFASEERVLFASGFPQAEEHARRHHDLLDMAMDAQARCRKLLQNSQLTECFNALLEFMVGDLLDADILFKSYLEEMDVKDRQRLMASKA